MTDEETKTVLGLGGRLITALPAQFLTLVVINVLALGFLFWFVDARANHTASVLNQLLQACLQRSQ